MFKRIARSTGVLALFAFGACGTEPDFECVTVSNTTQASVADTTITTSGLKYLETAIGSGATARSCRRVAIRYAGSFLDGRSFDPGNAFSFIPGTGGVVTGFEQGVIGMKEGGRRRIIVPPSLGYGAVARTNAAGEVVIPPNSTLVFDLELLDVE